VKLVTCQECSVEFSHAVRICPRCSWEVPKQVVERREAKERERRLHEKEASRQSILGSEPETLTVDGVSVHRHSKVGKPDSIRVTYRCGLATVSEWVCLDHGGGASRSARYWWRRRFGDKKESETITVDEALTDMFLGEQISRKTKTITVKRAGKYYEILKVLLHGEQYPS